MFSEIPADQLAGALDRCAAEILWEAGITEPPIDAALVAERIGLAIAHNVASPYRGRLVDLADPRGGTQSQGTIVVGPAERPERLQWAIAHEIGESVAYRTFDSLGIRAQDAPDDAREQVANHLASCLLLPRERFAIDGFEMDWDLLALKQRFATASHELIARRMLEMSVPIVVTLFDHGRIRWRRTNTGGRPPQLLPEESTAWRTAHKTGKACKSHCDSIRTGLDAITAWPIHEPDWKREILRSQIAEW